jgi:hypothetical protein
MPDNPDAPSGMPYTDTLRAPFLYFETVPGLAYYNGIISVTLTAGRNWVGQDGAMVDEQVVVAYLRCNIPAAISLRDALDKALLLAAPPAGEGKAN